MVINISVQYNGGFLPDITGTVDPRLLPSRNPVKYHVFIVALLFIAYVIVYFVLLQPCVMMYYNNSTSSVSFLLFFWCPCMAINVSVQYSGGLLPDIILLTQCYFHRGTRLNAMKRFYICSL